MSPRRPSAAPSPPQETRAEVARRRLAQLTESFEATQGRDVSSTPPAAESVPVEEVVPRAHRARRADRISALHVRVVVTAAVAAGVLLTWWLLAERPRTGEVDAPLRVSASADPSSSVPSPSAGPEVVVVDVAGKVREPGIVTLPAGSRVHEAIEAAGGLSGRVDGGSLNLARVLVDGEQVLVGIEPVAAPAGAVPGAPGGPAAGGTVDLNAATAEQLDALPGVGPVTAAAILEWREQNGRFSAVDDLLDVSGIGEKTLERLRDLVSV